MSRRAPAVTPLAASPHASGIVLPTADRKHLLIDAERVYYRGRLGHPVCRKLGCLTLYAAHRAPLHLSIDGRDAPPTRLAVVPPYVTHSVHSADDWVTCLLIEPEYLDLTRLPVFSRPGPASTAQLPWATASLLAQALSGAGPDDAQIDLSPDDLFYATLTLPRRQLDPRIDRLIRRMRDEAAADWSADDAAHCCGVSPSRLLHLFKAEIGVPFRHFRAWKRARQMLIYASSTDSLTRLAQDLGYTDSSYFSNSIRQVYGLRPKDILAGSRGLHTSPLPNG
ncbi:helix-turn-helix domain-containing protein [Aquabacterium sp.]|uniref:helix-turn-helix domain-containing protein n=1 Tax=Aquabacterium sp. TaxID=1872578 RepID=UPI0035B44B68